MLSLALSAPRVATFWLYVFDPALLARLRVAAGASLRAEPLRSGSAEAPAAPPVHTRSGALSRLAAMAALAEGAAAARCWPWPRRRRLEHRVSLQVEICVAT